MLDLPWDVLMASVEEDAAVATGPAILNSSSAGEGDVRRILDMLSAAQRPAIVVGSEANRNDARESVRRRAATTGAPVFGEFEARCS